MKEFNIVMIVLDGLRRSRIPICPFLSSLLKKGCFFSNMVTAAPYSLASFHSIFSSLYPSKNGVDSYFNMFKFKKDNCKTLTQYLHDNNYNTFAYVADDSLLPSQGFDDILIHDEYKEDLIKLHKKIITKLSKKKFFLFLQYSNIHTEVIKNVGKKYDDFDKEYFENYEINKKNYNSYLEKMDLYVDEIFNHIKSLDLLKNTILVILSDHGTSNGDKIGERMYGSFTYDYTINVFCNFIIPNIEGKEISFQTRTIDIMPTLLDILKIKQSDVYEPLQGNSLIPLVEGVEKEDRIAFSETGGLKGPWPSPKEHNVFCIKFEDYKLIYNKTPDTWEMYNLKQDPKENNNILGKCDEGLTLKLKKMLLDHIALNKKTILC